MLYEDDSILIAMAKSVPPDVDDYVYRMTYDERNWGQYGFADTGQGINIYVNGSLVGNGTPPDGENVMRMRCGHYFQGIGTRTNVFKESEDSTTGGVLYTGMYTACTWMAKAQSGLLQNVMIQSNWGLNINRVGSSLRLNEDDTVSFRRGGDLIFQTDPIDPTRWHHYAFTWDRENRISQFFLDGVRMYSGAGSYSTGYKTDSQFQLNHYEGSPSNPETITESWYADHRVYQRVLTDSEIRRVYRQLSWKVR